MKKKIAYCVLLFLILFILRLIDFSFLWKSLSSDLMGEMLSSLEYINQTTDSKLGNKENPKKSPEIYFEEIGMTILAPEKIFRNRIDSRSEDVVVLSYFDPFRPLTYMIYNKNDSIFLGSGCCITELSKGVNEMTIYKFELAHFRNTEKNKWFVYSVLNNLTFVNETKITDSSMTFNSHHLTIEREWSNLFFTMYTYLPLILIIILSVIINRALLLTLIYYFEMILLFGYKKILCNSQLWLYDFLGLDPQSNILSFVLAYVISVLLVMGIYYKLKQRKLRNFSLKEKWLVVFFLTLPLFLRF